MNNKILVYTCQRMSGRNCAEMVVEAQMLVRVLGNHNMEALNPVIEEKIPNINEALENVHPGQLEVFWRRDKEMIRESDVLLDYMTMNKSDGSNKEVAYNRFCLFKPTVRVWDGAGGLISRIEDDIVVPNLIDAITLIQEKWGTYEKLGQWRIEMLKRSYPAWAAYQRSLLTRYGLSGEDVICHL